MYSEGVYVVSIDEKSGMQALERKITSMKAGQCERQDHSYVRHGTQCLIGNFEIATGKMITPTIGDTRTEEDFIKHIEKLINTNPKAKWILVMDNLNTHVSESCVRLVARLCDLTIDLGKKGHSGILKDMASRAAFLENADHRIQFAYTPKHASWLNQIESWFSILSKKLLKRLSTISTEELKEKVLTFIEYFNNTMSKPFRWKFRGW